MIQIKTLILAIGQRAFHMFPWHYFSNNSYIFRTIYIYSIYNLYSFIYVYHIDLYIRQIFFLELHLKKNAVVLYSGSRSGVGNVGPGVSLSCRV